VGYPIVLKKILGRTLDRIWHARLVAETVRRLENKYNFDVIEAPEASLDADAIARDQRFRSRLLVSCHGGNRQGQSVSGPLSVLHSLDWYWSYRRELRILNRASVVVVPSEATRRVLLEQDVKAGCIEQVLHGIDVKKFVPSSPSKGNRPLNVCFVGRLQQSKGVDFIWRLAEELTQGDNVQFHLMGALHPGIRRQTINNLQRHRGIVHYHPPVPHTAMPEFYRSMDVMLLPSRFENFGLAYVEAMASGLLVFAGRGGSGSEIVRDGVTGFLVDPDGPVTTVRDMLRQCSLDRQSFDKIRAAARDEAVRRFSQDRFVREKLRTYGIILQSTIKCAQ
jgi:glycosyltransferase involved in cell wall biosynthesis